MRHRRLLLSGSRYPSRGAGLIGIDPPGRHTEESGNVHKVECEVKADDE